MERKGISLEKSSVALTLLSLSELVTYVMAAVLGDNLKRRRILVNTVASALDRDLRASRDVADSYTASRRLTAC